MAYPDQASDRFFQDVGAKLPEYVATATAPTAAPPQPAPPMPPPAPAAFTPAPMAPPPSPAADTSVSVMSPQTEVVGVQQGTAGGAKDTRFARQKEIEAQITDDSLATVDANRQAASQQADDEQAFHKRQAAAYVADADRVEDEQLRRDQELRAMEQDIATSSEELSKQKFDTSDKRDIWQRLADGIGAAAFAYSGNQAGVNAIAQRRKADADAELQAQKDQFAAKQLGLRGKETNYERMRARFGDDRIASDVVRSSLYKQRASELEALAAKAADVKQQEGYTNQAQQLRNHAAQLEHDAIKYVAGRPTMVQWRMPNGDVVSGTSKEFNAYKMSKGTKDEDASRQTASSVAVETAKGKASASGDLDKQATDYGKEVAKDAAAMETLGMVESAINAGHLTGKERTMALAGIKNPLINKWVNGDSAVAREQAWGQLKAQVISDISGSGVSDAERKNLTDMVEGAGDDASRLRAVQFSRNKIQARHAALRQAYSPEAVQRYDSRAPKPAANTGDIRSEE